MSEIYSIVFYKGTDMERTVFFKDKNSLLFHRKDGPAVIFKDGHKEWWINGNRHRINGPAIEYISGRNSFYLNGVFYKESNYWSEIRFGGFA